MKKLIWWGMAGLAAAGIVLTGCGNSSSNSSASLRLANATLTHPSLDLLINASVAAPGTATDTVSAYAAPASGSNTLQIDDAGNLTSLAAIVPTLTGGGHYTLLAYESAGTVKTAVLSEDQTLPISGSALMRVYNVAGDAGKLDVYITDPSVTDLANAGAPISLITGTAPYSTVYATYSPGTYRVRVTGYGNKSDLRLDIPAVTLANQQIATVVLTPTKGGVLLNGSALIQQSTYTATRNTNVRVRLAAAVSGVGTTVTATASAVNCTPTGNICPIDAGVSPAFGFYTLVPANSSLNINVASASVGAPATPLVAGTDMTLLVYGSPGNASATLLTDDNRLPSDPSTVKLRLINGVTGNVGALTLTANTAPVGIGILAGAASGYVSLPSSLNAMNLTLTSSVTGTYASNLSNILIQDTVYTVMAAGDVSAPVLLIR